MNSCGGFGKAEVLDERNVCHVRSIFNGGVSCSRSGRRARSSAASLRSESLSSRQAESGTARRRKHAIRSQARFRQNLNFLVVCKLLATMTPALDPKQAFLSNANAANVANAADANAAKLCEQGKQS